ncbi:MAG: hypothetical protein ACI9DJ_002776 [Algoriphagus sp.]|jgi:hypothetical protein
MGLILGFETHSEEIRKIKVGMSSVSTLEA